MTSPIKRKIYIDPFSPVYYNNELFSRDSNLNRDNNNEPYARLHENARRMNTNINTADYLLNSTDNKSEGTGHNEYYSFGILSNYENLHRIGNITLEAFIIFEPPAVAPKLYRNLKKLTDRFKHVYIHNTVGDGYSLKNVDVKKLKKLYWPQPYKTVIKKYWGNHNRKNKVVVINGNHIPRSLAGELYSKRIYDMAKLDKLNAVDLYGHGWNKWWSHRSMWPPYWINKRAISRIYKGMCEKKHKILSEYDFSLCYENMSMIGYVTEKIFDCLYSGTIPIYLGAPDIDKYLPSEIYIDYRNYSNITQLWEDVKSMPEKQKTLMRERGRDYLQSKEFMKYYSSLDNIFKL